MYALMSGRGRVVVFVTVVLAAMLAAGSGAAQAEAAGTLSVSIQGKGTVTGEGINCNESAGPDCSQFYANECEDNPDPPPAQFCFPPYKTVTAASDRDGYTFAGWTGCDDVVGRECGLTLNTSRSVTANFTDTTDPTVGGLAPGSGVHRGSVTLSASASDNSGSINRVEFRVRGALVATDSSAPYSVNFNTASVSDGAATIRATAFDGAGRSGYAQSTITIDNTAPNLTVTSGPDGQAFAAGETQTWTFGAADATSGVASVVCSVVAAGSPAAFAACSGGATSHSVSGLGEGDWAFTVRTTDAAGNVTAVGRTFAIDATAPETTITGKPAKRTTKRRARFTFAANEGGATFACKLDDGAYRSCSSPKTYRVGKGRHKLRVRATDAVGNREATPAVHAWKVVRRRR